jgi:hypothetical protein
MNGSKVLWIEDDADNDLYNLTSPVYIDGRYQLDIAINASEAYYYLNSRVYEIVIVDIRIPPGMDPDWREKHEQLGQRNEANASRLGLELLRAVFSQGTSRPAIPENLAPERYGVFTVEGYEELKHDLHQLGLARIKYKQKNATMPNTALLEFIDEISANGPQQ